VDTGLNKNQTELGVLILTVLLQMLTDLNSLLDKHVKILGDLRSESVRLEDTDNLLSSDRADGSNALGVTKNDTNLGGGESLLGKLAYVILYVGSRDLEP
jgi:hypothetical protein